MSVSPPSPLQVLVVALVVAACGQSPGQTLGSRTAAPTAETSSTTAATDSTSTTASTTTPSDPDTSATAEEPSSATEPSSTSNGSERTGDATTIEIRLRLDRRVDDASTEGFASLVRSVLTDERGWTRAGFGFTFDDADFDFTVVLAEGAEVDELCLPYNTYGRFSCQNGPVVALNADRWRTAVDTWPGTLDEYRTMLVNHEVGHLLGQHHPASRCPGDGMPAPVMSQQSSGVAPCTANPWPLPWEIACAEQGVEPLAPPYERDISLTCGPDGPAR